MSGTDAEAGRALCRKYAGQYELFTGAGFNAYAQDLLVRITNPFLRDAIARITRDLPRKLSWEDRVIGTMRLVLAQEGEPVILAEGAMLAAEKLFSNNSDAIRDGLEKLWPEPWSQEHEILLEYIVKII